MSPSLRGAEVNKKGVRLQLNSRDSFNLGRLFVVREKKSDISTEKFVSRDEYFHEHPLKHLQSP